MPQISLYIDEDTLHKVETAAKRSNLSLSKWVALQIKAKIEPVYPPGYEELFGSLTTEELTRPPQPDHAQDSPRESL